MSEHPITLSESVYLQANFFAYAESMRAQYEWKVIMSQLRRHELLLEKCGEPHFRFYSAQATRLFSLSLLTEFLSATRRLAGIALGARFVSTPQVQVFSEGCWRSLSTEFSVAPWRYLYCVSREAAEVSVVSPKRGILKWLPLTRKTAYKAAFNTLLIHRSDTPYSIELGSPHPGARSPEGTVILTGQIW